MRFWRIAGVGFVVINLAGGIYAAATGEMMHASTHFILLAGALAVWQARSARKRTDVLPDASGGIDPQLQHLQQSLDAIALEVERIGESQRFITKLQHQQVEGERSTRVDPASP